MNNNNFKRNFELSFRYYDKIKKIIRQNLNKLMKIEESDKYRDMKEATDMVLKMNSGDIAVRVRRNDFNDPFNDVTIRTKSKSDQKTEIDKIQDGYGKWYFYGWNKVKDWLIYDIDKLRELLNNNKDFDKIKNNDGTKFISISLSKLKDYNALITASKDVMKYYKELGNDYKRRMNTFNNLFNSDK